MVEEGKIDKNETTICYVTGNGLKATESIMSVLTKPKVMQADVAKISAVIGWWYNGKNYVYNSICSQCR